MYVPRVHCHADKAKAALECQIHMARMRRKAFLRTANDNHDRTAWLAAQNCLTALTRNRRHAECHEVIPKDGPVEVGMERQQMWPNTGEQLGHMSTVGTEAAHSAKAKGTMRMVSKQVATVRWELGGFVQRDRKVAGEPLVQRHATQPLHRTASGDWRMVKTDPYQV
jgi:hypothetical protein